MLSRRVLAQIMNQAFPGDYFLDTVVTAPVALMHEFNAENLAAFLTSTFLMVLEACLQMSAGMTSQAVTNGPKIFSSSSTN